MILTAGLVVCALTIPQPAPAGAAFTAILMVSGLAFLLGLAEVVRTLRLKPFYPLLWPSPIWNAPMVNCGASNR